MTTNNFGLVGSVCVDSAEKILEHWRLYGNMVDILEWRLDSLQAVPWSDLQHLRNKLTQPLIITYRPQAQGGMAVDDMIGRLAFWRKAACLRPDYIDFEDDVPPAFWQEMRRLLPNCQLIRSYHGPHHDLDYNVLVSKLNRDADWVKLACTCKNSFEVVALYKAWSDSPYREKTIALATGRGVSWSRWLAAAIGVPWVYTALVCKGEYVEGQSNLTDWMNWREYFGSLRPSALFALLGSSVEQSIGDKVHNAWFQRERPYPAAYVKIPIPRHELSRWLAETGSWPFYGYSVTMPLKVEAYECADKRSALVKKLGVANTLTRIGKRKWSADNTDVEGVRSAFRCLQKGKVEHCVIAGAGGSARACVNAIRGCSKRVTIINRSYRDWLKPLTLENVDWFNLDQVKLHKALECDVFINTIPEDYDDEKLCEVWDSLKVKKLVIDILYQQGETSLLRRAKSAGLVVQDGLSMWYYQGIAQQHIWREKTQRQLNMASLREAFAHLCFDSLVQTYRFGWEGCPSSE